MTRQRAEELAVEFGIWSICGRHSVDAILAACEEESSELREALGAMLACEYWQRRVKSAELGFGDEQNYGRVALNAAEVYGKYAPKESADAGK